MMRQQKKTIVRLIFPVFLVMVLCYGPNLFSQEMKADTISIEKKEFEPGEDIRIEYRCSEYNLPYLWIGIFKADIDDQMMKDAGLSIKVLGKLNASVLLNTPDTPGNYQVRFFSMRSGNVSVFHRLNFEVKEKENFKNKSGTTKDDINKNIKITEKRDAEGIATPSKTLLESVALEVKKSQEIGVYPFNAKTKFKRKEDGFEILNAKGSRWAGLGECLGHVAFAKYYFENHKTEGNNESNLHGRYSDKKYGEYGTTIINKPTLAAHIIVTLANSKIKQDKSSFNLDRVLEKHFGWPFKREKKIFECMLTNFNKNKPVLLNLIKDVDNIDEVSYHAVLAYANVYDKAKNESKISIYDPNFADKRYLVYNHSKMKFDDYIVTFTGTDKKGKKSPRKRTFKVLKIVGDDAEIKLEDLSEIFKKAEDRFTPDVAIETFPGNEAEVCLPHVTIEGTLGNFKKKTTHLTKVSIFNKVNDDNGPSFIEYKDESITAKDEFSIKVTLDKGKNKLHFATFAKNNHTGNEYEALNTYEVDDNFILNYKPPTIALSPPPGKYDIGTSFKFWVDGRSDKQYLSPSFKFKWVFGDEKKDEKEDGKENGWIEAKPLPTKETPVTHQYSRAGKFKVKLQVTDKDNMMKEVKIDGSIIIKQKVVAEVKKDPPPSTKCPKLEYVITPMSIKMREGSINRSLNQTASEGYKLISGLIGAGTFVKEENNNTIYPVKVLITRRGVDIERMNQYANDHWVVLNGLFLLYMIQDKDAPLYEYTNLGNLDHVSKHDLSQYKNYLPGGKNIDLLNDAGSKGWELIILSGNAVCRRIKNDPVKYKYMSFIFSRDNIEEFKKLGEEGWQYCTSPTSLTGQTGIWPVILKQRVGKGDSFHFEVVIKKIANSFIGSILQLSAESFEQMEDANAERAVILQEHGKKGWLYKGEIEFGKGSSDGRLELFIFQVPKSCR